jgi:hypothetical protein
VHIFDNASGSAYSPARWQNHFRNDPSVSSDLNMIIQTCPKTIGRADVRHFAGKARSGGYDDLRRLFLASMLWGWGSGGKWKEGLKNTEAALSDPALRQMLESAAERINKAQIKEAYTGFKLKGCRRAFFTKFFYFVGYEWAVSPLPLILDSHVEGFLGCLGRQEGWAKMAFTDAQGYLQYVTSMNDWAKELGCQADCIEYFMFKRQKGKTTSKQRLREGRMGATIQKASDKNTQYLRDAVEFCNLRGLGNECQKILGMECPAKWRLDKGGDDENRPTWCFGRAVRGNFIVMWGAHRTGLPTTRSWTDLPCSKATLESEIGKYLKTPEGQAWYQSNKPDWLDDSASGKRLPAAQTSSVTITLAPEDKSKLDEFAKKCGVEAETLVRIWVLEHLAQLDEE